MPIVNVKATRYETLQRNPLFFIHKTEREIWVQTKDDPYGHKEYEYYWTTNDDSIFCWLKDDTFGDNHKYDGYMLVIAESNSYIPVYNRKKENEDTVEVQIHNISVNTVNDWIVVLNSCLSRMGNTNDKYAFINLLWCLDNREVKKDILEEAIGRYDIKAQSYLINMLKEVGVCLSITKQQVLQQMLTKFNIKYKIYNPTVVTAAISIIAPKFNFLTSNRNIFVAIDLILNDLDEKLPFEIEYHAEKMKVSGNILINIYTWLHDDTMCLGNYEGLKQWFALFSKSVKLKIIKRYFHDIRLGVATYDEELLSAFKDNRFEKFSRFRYCIETPEEPITVTIPLLCDTVVTFMRSEGRTFQSLNGILDVAVLHCDTTKPNVDFALQKILPVCNGGAVYNKEHFKGFIDYDMIYQLMEDKMNKGNLENVIKCLLNKYAKQSFYYVCGNSGSNEPLATEQVMMCKNVLHGKLECLEQKYYDDIWSVYNDEKTVSILNCLLSIPIKPATDNNKIVKMEINWNMVSIERFAANIRNFAQSLATNVENGYIFNDGVGNYGDILKFFYKPAYVRVYSRKTTVLNPTLDLFNLWAEFKEKLPPNCIMQPDNPVVKKMKAKHREREALEVKSRVEKSLTKELKTAISVKGFFEFPYDEQLWRHILQLYYYKDSIAVNEPENSLKFLEQIRTGKYANFCAPEFSGRYNTAINLPYFWCRGRECFRNNLSDQMLEQVPSWKHYSLYHIIEILGYSKLHQTEAGLEPDSIIRRFIAMVTRAHVKFRRLKCRSCGHLMFTDKSSGYNRYNYYSCINPTCGNFNHPVYLNYCYKCKKGLIDSRDTKQCPNGWYICPTCLSCCDDELYERQAQRYVLSGRIVPERILLKIGQGHNNKDVFYCPDCGIRLTKILDENRGEMIWCVQCKKDFNNIQKR